MSHFTAVHTVISDVNILTQCLKECGLRVQTGIAIRGYNGSLSPVTYPIAGCCDKLQQDLGYALSSDGTYTCNFHSDAAVGELMAKVAQKYASRMALEDAARVRGLTGANVNVMVHGR